METYPADSEILSVHQPLPFHPMPSRTNINPILNPLLLKQSPLLIKRGLIPTRRFVTLAAPRNMDEVQRVFEACFVKDPFEPIQNKAIPWLGAITMACSASLPILIISSSQEYDDPVFITLDSTTVLREEEEMERPCCFELSCQDEKVVFYGKSSVEYSNWIGLVRLAVDMAKRQKGHNFGNGVGSTLGNNTIDKGIVTEGYSGINR